MYKETHTFRRPALAVLVPVLVLILAVTASGCGGDKNSHGSPAGQGGSAGGSDAQGDSSQPNDGSPADASYRDVPVDAPLAGIAEAGSPQAATGLLAAGSVVGTEPAAPQASVPAAEEARVEKPAPGRRPAAFATGAYCLQVGSFRDRGHAEKRQAQLSGAGIPSDIVSVQVGGDRFHRVMVPDLADRREADRIGSRLRDELGLDFLVRQQK